MKTQLKLVTMYNEVKNLSKDCKSISAISRKSGLDRKTVRKYLGMAEDELESYMEKIKHRKQMLLEYEPYVTERIRNDPECTAAQVEDWLKENVKGFPTVSARTVYNFVHWVRSIHHLPKPKVVPRQCEAVEELPYGKQAQTDFGESWLLDANSNRIKVYFMTIVLSRSRARFVYFTNQPVTTWFLLRAHEQAFCYFEGMPQEIVYDQDSTILVDENAGELLFTHAFEQYVLHAGFHVYMCHKADPQSKGRIENNVRYVKGNFLHGRQFSTLDELNRQGMDWLNRTANAKVHSTTRLVPHQEWLVEKDSLRPFSPIPQGDRPGVPYGVRKDNTVLFRGNRYALPKGTYQGPVTQVRLKLNDGTIDLTQMDGKILDTFQLETQKGKLIRNVDRKRDTSLRVAQLERSLTEMFSNKQQASLLLASIRERFPRYVRDQYNKVLLTIKDQDQQLVDDSLSYCVNRSLFAGSEFANVLNGLKKQQNSKKDNPLKEFKPKATAANLIAILSIVPQRSNMSDYQNLLAPAP